MIIDVSGLEDRILRVERALDLSDLHGEATDPVEVHDAFLRGEASRGARGVEFRGRLTARLQLQCGRCLEPYESPLDAGFRLVIVREADETGEAEDDVELDPDDLDQYEAPEGKVDLRAVAREQVHLNLPLKPVCRPDCRGLCPTCGGNRNRIECGCSTDEPDPRLAPLLELKKRLQGS